MAEERIDPFLCENYWRVDHLSRYIFALSLCRGKTVLDAACGFGYGAALLANNGAKEVIGVDNSTDAIEEAAKRYGEKNVSFEVADLEQPLPLGENRFDLVVSFETLEHLEQAHTALDHLVRALSENGILIISVPGEKDAESENPFHLQHFTKESFVSMLRERFAHVTLHQQILTVGSTIHSSAATNPLPFKESTKMEEVAQSRDWMLDTDSIPDSYVAVCGNQAVPVIENIGSSSRLLWLEVIDDLKRWKDYGHNQEARASDSERDLEVKIDEINRWTAWAANTELIIKHLEGQRKDLWQRIGQLTAINNRQQESIEELQKKLKQD